ncbi:hypothetical protein PMm318_A60320 [Pseudomonas moorei]
MRAGIRWVTSLIDPKSALNGPASSLASQLPQVSWAFANFRFGADAVGAGLPAMGPAATAQI